MLKRTPRRLALVLLVVIGLALVLAACGGDEDETPPAPEATGTPTPRPTETPFPIDQPDPTNTPFVPPDDDLFEDAVSIARGDLAARLDLSVNAISAVDPTEALFIEEPLECPELVEIDEEQVNYLYLQVQETLYPYQFYRPTRNADLIVEKCDDEFLDEEVLYVPTPNMRVAVADAVRAELNGLGIDVDQGDIASVEAITWTDTNLGCPVYDAEAREDVTPALIDGYRVVFVLGDDTYEYHTDASAEQIVLCEAPPGFAAAEDFITALEEMDFYDVEVLEDEVATYEGLAAEGLVVGLTIDEYRVGVFQFDTPEDALAAADQIDDPIVSYIFVSGNLLLVQEEDNPQVYSVLRSTGELVRSPVRERFAEDDEGDPGDEDAEAEEDIEGLSTSGGQ